MGKSPEKLLSRKLLARNSLLNILGSVLPLLVGLVAIPLLIRGIGTERFGVLSLVWMFVGYFSLFDLGLGKAITKLVAEKIGTNQEYCIPQLVWTSALLMLVLSFVGMGMLLGSSHLLVRDVLKLSGQFAQETILSFYAIALSLPFIINTSLLRGVLIAYQRFGLVNAIRIPQGILNFLAPLAVVYFSSNLFIMVLALIGLRVLVWGAHLYVCMTNYSHLYSNIQIRRNLVRPLLSFGGWMTVTNIVSPLMTYLDRFLIASVVSTTAIAYYTAPYQVVSKLLIVPFALLGVLFPAFSSSLSSEKGQHHLQQLFENAIQVISFTVFPLVLFIVYFAHDGLVLWVGSEFADNSAVVLQLLAVGIFFNSISLVPFTLLQGVGRPDLTAKFHLLECPVYIVVLWLVLPEYGIVGAAAVWLGRIVFDGVLLFSATIKLYPVCLSLVQRLLATLGILSVCLLPGVLIQSVSYRLTTLFLSLLGFVFVFYWLLLGRKERNTLWHYWKRYVANMK